MKRFLIWLLAGALLLCGCRKNPQEAPADPASPPAKDAQVQETKPIDPSRDAPPSPTDVSSDGQLTGRAETREEAEEIAALYGIELVDCQNGLALFRTEEDPQEVIRRGEENGWPQLHLNRTLQLY